MVSNRNIEINKMSMRLKKSVNLRLFLIHISIAKVRFYKDNILNSTLRLFSLPSSVAFVSMGSFCPMPL